LVGVGVEADGTLGGHAIMGSGEMANGCGVFWFI